MSVSWTDFQPTQYNHLISLSSHTKLFPYTFISSTMQWGSCHMRPHSGSGSWVLKMRLGPRRPWARLCMPYALGVESDSNQDGRLAGQGSKRISTLYTCDTNWISRGTVPDHGVAHPQNTITMVMHVWVVFTCFNRNTLGNAVRTEMQSSMILSSLDGRQRIHPNRVSFQYMVFSITLLLTSNACL